MEDQFLRSRSFLPDVYLEWCEGLGIHLDSFMASILIIDQEMDIIKTAAKPESDMQTVKRIIVFGWPEKRKVCPQSIIFLTGTIGIILQSLMMNCLKVTRPPHINHVDILYSTKYINHT